MVSFYVRADKLKNTDKDFNRISADLAQIAQEVNTVRNSQVLRGHGAFTQVRRSLQNTYNNTISLRQKNVQMRLAMWDAVSAYERTENSILGFEIGKSKIVEATAPVNSIFNNSFNDDLYDIIENIILNKSIISPLLRPIISPATAIPFLLSGLLFNGAKPYNPTSTYADAGWWGMDVNEDHPGITAWIGKATAGIKGDYGSAEVNAYLGKAEAELKADAGFMKYKYKNEYKDEEWSDKEVFTYFWGEVSAGASIAAVSANAKGNLGNDMLGVEGKVEGDAGVAKLKGTLKASVGEDGVTAVAKGEAMVSAVEGKASGTINILGLEITGKVSGYAGALGAEGKVGIENNKFVLEGGAAAVLGLSAGVEIGFNDEGWDNFVDGVNCVVGEVAGAVEDVVDGAVEGVNDFVDGFNDFVDYISFWD